MFRVLPSMAMLPAMPIPIGRLIMDPSSSSAVSVFVRESTRKRVHLSAFTSSLLCTRRSGMSCFIERICEHCLARSSTAWKCSFCFTSFRSRTALLIDTPAKSAYIRSCRESSFVKQPLPSFLLTNISTATIFCV